MRSDSEVVGVDGQDQFESIVVRDRQTNAEERVVTGLLFIFIGAQPCKSWLNGAIFLDEHGFVRTDPALMKNEQLAQLWTLARDPMLLETSVPGIGEGSVVAQFVHHHLSGS